MEENKNEQDLSTKKSEQAPELESNAARRLRLLGIENDSKIHDTKEEITKGNFWSNLWYKRKWTIIISAFFIIMAIILLCTMIFKKDPDLTIGYIGPNAEKVSSIQSVLEPLVLDANKNGKQELVINGTKHQTERQLGKNKTQSAIKANKEAASSFYEGIRLNNFYVVLIDKELYEESPDWYTWFYSVDELIEMGASIDKDANKNLFYESAEFTGDDEVGKRTGLVFDYTKLAEKNKKDLTDIMGTEDVILCFCRKNVASNPTNAQITLLNNILALEKAE